MDAKQRIDFAKQKLERAEKAQTVAETQKATAEQEIETLKGKMQELGVTPDTLPEELARIEAQVDEKLTKAEQLIPSV